MEEAPAAQRRLGDDRLLSIEDVMAVTGFCRRVLPDVPPPTPSSGGFARRSAGRRSSDGRTTLPAGASPAKVSARVFPGSQRSARWEAPSRAMRAGTASASSASEVPPDSSGSAEDASASAPPAAGTRPARPSLAADSADSPESRAMPALTASVLPSRATDAGSGGAPLSPAVTWTPFPSPRPRRAAW